MLLFIVSIVSGIGRAPGTRCTGQYDNGWCFRRCHSASRCRTSQQPDSHEHPDKVQSSDQLESKCSAALHVDAAKVGGGGG